MGLSEELLDEKGEHAGFKELTLEHVWEACREAVRKGLPVTVSSKHFKSTSVFGQQTKNCDEVRALLSELHIGKEEFMVIADNRGVAIRSVPG
jgi:hypothetical protein